MKTTIKKTISMLMVIMMLMGCIGLSASAADDLITFSFSPRISEYYYGDTAVIAVKVQNDTDEEKSFTVDVFPRNDYIFTYEKTFTVENVAPGSEKTVYYEMEVHKAESNSIIDIIIRFIKSIKFLFEKYDYKTSVSVEGSNKTIGFNVYEIPASDMNIPSIDTNGEAVFMTPNEIVKTFNDAVNDLKTYKGEVDISFTETVSIKAENMPQVVETVANSLIESLVGTSQREYSFDNGKTAEGITIDERVFPFGRNVALTVDDIVSAQANKREEGGYVYKLVVASDVVQYDKTSGTTDATHHEKVIDPLELWHLDLGPVEIEEAELTYPGAVLYAVTDADGRLVRLYQYIPIEGDGTASVMSLSLSASISGSQLLDWVMIYG